MMDKNSVPRVSSEKIFTLPDLKRITTVLVFGGLATLFFTVIYGYTNFRASQLSGLARLYSEWETTLPLVPWMVYPYLSLNLLFGVVIFVVRDLKEIRTFCLSLCAGAVLAGIVFYFFPGELGFARASGEGHLGIFDQIYAIDYPHNLFPSLHVTYSTLAVWAMRRQVKSRAFRFFLWTWLALISISVVLTHQHHLFDVVSGGALAALLISYFYRKPPVRVGENSRGG